MARAAKAADRRALVMIHCQQDFFAGGACAVDGAEAIFGPIALLRRQTWNLAVHLLDSHPVNHSIFSCNRPVSCVVESGIRVVDSNDKCTQGQTVTADRFSTEHCVQVRL